MDIDVLAGLLFLGGFLGMAGALVSPQLASEHWLLVRTLALAGLMICVAAGLWCRHDWARRFAVGAMVYAIYGQVTRRWMQSDVVQAWWSCAQGATLQEPVPAGSLPPLSPESALLSLLVCVLLALMARALLSTRLRGEFVSPGRVGSAHTVVVASDCRR